MKTQTFELLVDKAPYEVQAIQYQFNTETRFRVSFNGSPVYVFVWDEELKRYTAIGDGAGVIPDSVETAISEKLLQHAHA